MAAFGLGIGFLFTACDEVSEPTAYDNWQERNEAYIDSISALTGNVTSNSTHFLPNQRCPRCSRPNSPPMVSTCAKKATAFGPKPLKKPSNQLISEKT